MFHQKGFTLIEILVVIAVIGVIISFGMAIDLNTFGSDTFRAEQSTIVSVLERARSRSMSNAFDSAHGVCYIAPDYIIFRNGTCAISATSESIRANTNIAGNPSTILPTIVFSRLTGNTISTTFHITNGIKSADIIINDEGTINW